jgi:cleavage and polyadenylation specificity factor subunit 2
LRRITDDKRNLVILTEKASHARENGSTDTIARTLWTWWEERQGGLAIETSTNGDPLELVYSGGKEIQIKDAKRAALDGNDLAVYQQFLATQRQLQTTLLNGGTATLESSADAVDDASSDSSSDSEGSETEQQGKALNISATMGQANRKKIGLSDEDLGINVLLRRKGVHDYDVRGKKGREKMFPMAIRRKRNDDFGELIRPEDFLRAEEREDTDAQDARPEGKYETKDSLGKKRKWDDVAVPSDRLAPNGGNKRQQIGERTKLDPDLADLGAFAPGLDDEGGLEEVEEEVIGPSRLVYTAETVTINLRLAFVDFAGLHDKRSLQMLIPLIQPRKLILVSGMKEETLALASECRKLLAAQIGGVSESAIDIYTPEIGAVVNASVDTNAWTVKLTDALVKRIRWQKVKGLGIVTVTGRLVSQSHAVEAESGDNNATQESVKENDEESPAQEAIDTEKPQTKSPTLDVLPSSMASATRSVAQPLHVGDLRLADLRKIMQSSGHTAEFRGEGTLLIDGSVIVRKTGTGRIEVESMGTVASRSSEGNTFYAVRGKIYEGLAVVAGG